MRVALVHESIAGFHGSERVLAAVARLYPEAPIFVTVCRAEALRGTALEGRDVRPSVLERLPWLRGRHRLLLPLMPYAVEQHDLRGFDVVISSHHAAAHGVLTRADQLHLVYTHSPARYAWDLYHDHVPPGRRSPLKRYALHRFRQWDVAAAQRADAFACNSNHVAARIRKTYRREARVIYPPVETGRFAPSARRGGHYLLAGRLVGYKNLDAAVRAFAGFGGTLEVVGDGPETKRLRRLAGSNVRFRGAVSDHEFAAALAGCRALIFPGEEDFGLVPVEAMAAGTPVIAWRKGGVTETVEDGVTGVFFDQPTPEAIREAVVKFEKQGVTAGPKELQCVARRFGVERFEREFADWVDGAWQRFND